MNDAAAPNIAITLDPEGSVRPLTDVEKREQDKIRSQNPQIRSGFESVFTLSGPVRKLSPEEIINYPVMSALTNDIGARQIE